MCVQSCVTLSQKRGLRVRSWGSIYASVQINIRASVCPCVNTCAWTPGCGSVQGKSAPSGLCWVGMPGCLTVCVPDSGALVVVLPPTECCSFWEAYGAQPLTRAQTPTRAPPRPRLVRPRRAGALAARTRTPCCCFRTVGFTLAKIWIVCFTISSPALYWPLTSQALVPKT